MSETPLLPGATLGPYVVEEELGRGALGIVYRCHHVHLGRLAAVKVMHPYWTTSREFVERFRDEARVLALLDYPSILRVYDAGEHQGVFYIATQLLTGRTLEEILLDGLDVNQAVDATVQLAGALGYAHKSGVIHRDVKPANVMVSDAGQVTLMDFGVARLMASPGMTMPGIQVGTPYYMAPELILGRRPDARSDLYALGIVLHQMLAGSPPFPGPDTEAVFRGHMHEPPPPVPSDVPDELREIVRRCLEKSPEHRYQTAAELEQALEAFRAPGSPPARSRSRRPALALPPQAPADSPAGDSPSAREGLPAVGSGAAANGSDALTGLPEVAPDSSRRVTQFVRREWTVVALDIAGSSRMKLPGMTLAVHEQFARFRKYVQEHLIEQGVGPYSWSGDGLIALFEHPRQAIQAAINVVDGLADYNREEAGPSPIRVRVGIQSGPVLMAEDQPLGEITSATLDTAGHLQKHAREDTIYITERVMISAPDVSRWRPAGAEYDVAFSSRVFALEAGSRIPGAGGPTPAVVRPEVSEYSTQVLADSDTILVPTTLKPFDANQPSPWEALVAPATRASLRLEIQVGGASSLQVIQGTTVLGRPDTAVSRGPKIVLTGDDAISRRHARLVKQPNGWFIEDLNSANGTALNGAALEPDKLYPVKAGDRIAVGERTLILVSEGT